MQDGKLDLAFMGVHGIWTEDLGEFDQLNRCPSAADIARLQCQH